MKVLSIRKQSAIALIACSVLVFIVSTSRSSVADKIKPEELVARHLESIGTAKARELYFIADRSWNQMLDPGT